MPGFRSRLSFGAAAWLVAALGGLLAAAPPAAAAEPVRLALVVGESAYAALPPLPACAGSARTIGAALKHGGFEVIQKTDTTNGETDAALAAFVKRLAEAPGSTAVLYFCGYAAGLETRSFLLPVSATIERPFDVLTQGVVAHSLLDAVVTTGTAGGLLALDVFAQPGSTTPPPLDRLAPAPPGPGHGYVAVAETNAADAPTPLANALASGLAPPTVEIGALLGDLQRRLTATPGAKLVALAAPGAPSFLAGGPPRAAPVAKQEPQPAPAPAPAPPPPVAVAAPPPPTAAPAPAAQAPPIPPMPDESQMSEADRRRVQAALAMLGYYDGRLDGQFGPETRAAIRRYQHEIGVEMTGRLTPGQAGRLVAGRS